MNQTINREILEISLEDIVPNRFQPRLTFDTEALNELANSIKEHGIIQPLVVRRLNDKYEIIAGERRFKAATLIGMKKVPCVVMELSDNESAEVAVIENIQRKEMTPLEEAKAYKKILDKGYLTQDVLAKRMGKSQSSVANKLRLLNLDEVVQDAILDGKISERHARSLLKIEDKQEQRNILSEIINNRLTVRQTDELIKEKYNKEEEKEETNNMIQEDIFKVSEEKKVEPQPNTTYMSMPEINIPMSNITNDVNPQLNIMHNIGQNNEQIQNNIIEKNIEKKEEEYKPSSSLDIFKFDSAPQPVTTTKEEIQNVINPQVFSNIEQPKQEPINNTQESINNNINNGMSVDINEIKNNSEDIIKKSEPTKDITELLSKDNKPENKFFIDLDIPEDMNNSLDKVSSSKEEIDKVIEELKKKGINITKEEVDLGSSYQIIIRIDK